MGPAITQSELPKRPKFSWDIKSVPWTDGRGNQEEYANSVALWSAFHEKLPNNNSNKIPSELRGIMLQSQLFGRARDLVKKIDDEVIHSPDGAYAIVKAIHKRDALSAVSSVYQDFLRLLGTKRATNESFKNYEARFEAQLSRFHAHSNSCFLPDALTAFMLLANANVDTSQRISVLAASSPRDTSKDAEFTTESYLNKVHYEAIASVLRQCDRTKGDVDDNSVSANNATTPVSFPRGRKKRNLTPEQLADLKSKSICRECHKKGHWASDHNEDGTLKPGVKSEPATISGTPKRVPKKSMTFNMVNISDSCIALSNDFVGPLLDDGAPYSGLGVEEFKVLQELIMPNWDGSYDKLPKEIQDRPYWQYGTGNHSSDKRKIIGSIMLTAKTETGQIMIRHLVIEGSSQWILGRNVTKKCNIVHIGGNFLELPDQSRIPITNKDFHSYISGKLFFSKENTWDEGMKYKLFCAAATIQNETSSRSWAELRKIVDKVHKHVCGHSTYSDIKILLQRNNLWNDEVMKYLARTIESCSSCHNTALPKPTRKVSLSTMSREFNDTVCVDHLHIDDMRILHIMDSATRYSAGAVVQTTNMEDAIIAFDSHWVSQFWTPENVLYDPAFHNEEFKSYLLQLGSECKAIPPRRHNKNVLESKHRVIRDVYLRLKGDSTELSENKGRLLVNMALRITNDLYGSDTMSSFELAKGFTRPALPGTPPIPIPEEIRAAHENLQAKRKLTLILRSKATTDNVVKAGDLVQVYLKNQKEKRGKWTDPRPVLSFDKISHSVTVPGKNGRTVNAAVEDVRLAVADNALARMIQESIDELQNALQIEIDEIPNDQKQGTIGNDQAPEDNESDHEVNASDDPMSPKPNIGDSVEVYWPQDKTYYPGNIDTISDDGLYTIAYDDGDVENDLNFDNELWRYCTPAVNSNSIKVAALQELESQEQELLENYAKSMGYNSFMLHEADGLPSSVLHNSYTREEEKFKQTVKEVHVSAVPDNANIISSHVIYKIKKNDDGSYKMKARIAPHGNKDKERENLKSDSATCPPTGIRVLLSIASLLQWPLAKVDFTSAYLQTGPALRDVYVIPPRECRNRSNYWLLLTAAYGLVNAGAKWQDMSDDLLRSLGFKQLRYIPQLFYIAEDEELKLIAVKIVDDVLFAGQLSFMRTKISEIEKRHELGTIMYGPGEFLFFGLTITQDDYYSTTIHGEEKLNMIESYPLSRTRRRQIDDKLNAVELKAFRSVNSKIGWLGLSASPFCSLYASYLQQRAPDPTVRDLITQVNALRLMKKFGSVIQFKRPDTHGPQTLSLLVFCDASRSKTHGQICYIAGLLIGDLSKGSIFHTISWTSHKSRRPVKSIGTAETLAAGEGIDEGKVIAKTFEVLLGTEVQLFIVVDSKDLFTTLSTCRNASDRSIRADVSVIRFEFETQCVSRMIWVPGKTNLADPGTKPNSPLDQALQLMLFTGEIPISFEDAISRSSHQSTG